MMKRFLPFAIFMTFLLSVVVVGHASANAERPSVIQQVTKDATVYGEASMESATMGHVTQGSFVKTTPFNEQWTHIQTQQLEGYVATTTLTTVRPDKLIVAKKGWHDFIYISKS